VVEHRDLKLTVREMSGVKIETVEVERVRQPEAEAAS
jgi:hypothetical protein